MTQIVINRQAGDQLQSVQDEVVVLSEDGRVLGVFHPVLQPPYPPELIPPVSDEEMERAYADPRRYTTEEVLQHLRSL